MFVIVAYWNELRVCDQGFGNLFIKILAVILLSLIWQRLELRSSISTTSILAAWHIAEKQLRINVLVKLIWRWCLSSCTRRKGRKRRFMTQTLTQAFCRLWLLVSSIQHRLGFIEQFELMLRRQFCVLAHFVELLLVHILVVVHISLQPRQLAAQLIFNIAKLRLMLTSFEILHLYFLLL